MEKVTGITYSNISNHFVIHIPSEYDYNMSCVYKDEFIQTLINIFSILKLGVLELYFVDDIDLNKFSQKEGE